MPLTGVSTTTPDPKYTYDSGIIAQQTTGYTTTNEKLLTLPNKPGKKAFAMIKGSTTDSGADPTVVNMKQNGVTKDTCSIEISHNTLVLTAIVELNGEDIQINHNNYSQYTLKYFSLTLFEL